MPKSQTSPRAIKAPLPRLKAPSTGMIKHKQQIHLPSSSVGVCSDPRTVMNQLCGSKQAPAVLLHHAPSPSPHVIRTQHASHMRAILQYSSLPMKMRRRSILNFFLFFSAVHQFKMRFIYFSATMDSERGKKYRAKRSLVFSRPALSKIVFHCFNPFLRSPRESRRPKMFLAKVSSAHPPVQTPKKLHHSGIFCYFFSFIFFIAVKPIYGIKITENQISKVFFFRFLFI